MCQFIFKNGKKSEVKLPIAVLVMLAAGCWGRRKRTIKSKGELK